MFVIKDKDIRYSVKCQEEKRGRANAAALWTFLGAEKAFSCKDDLKDDESGTFYARKAQKVT